VTSDKWHSMLSNKANSGVGKSHYLVVELRLSPRLLDEAAVAGGPVCWEEPPGPEVIGFLTSRFVN